MKHFWNKTNAVAVYILAAFILSCCSDNAPNDQSNSTNTFGLNDFSATPSVNERYGTVTSRNLNPSAGESLESAVVDSINSFSLALHRSIAAHSPDENSIESGYSSANVLALASSGAGGNTYQGLVELLGLSVMTEDDIHQSMNRLSLSLLNRSNNDVALNIANRLFVEPNLDLANQMLDIATESYGAPVTVSDFLNDTSNVETAINDWVSEKTNDFIPKFIDNIDPLTRFIMVNALFLDAGWTSVFEQGIINFRNINGEANEVEAFGGRRELLTMQNESLSAVEIPYQGEELALLIIMPENLNDYEATLDTNSLTDIVNNLTLMDTALAVPSWSHSSEINLAEQLAPIGFPAQPWDLSRMINGQHLEIKIKSSQMAAIEVDENGTKVAAATTVSNVPISVPKIEMVFNRPFFYAIRDRITGLVLFTGRIVNP